METLLVGVPCGDRVSAAVRASGWWAKGLNQRAVPGSPCGEGERWSYTMHRSCRTWEKGAV